MHISGMLLIMLLTVVVDVVPNQDHVRCLQSNELRFKVRKNKEVV